MKTLIMSSRYLNENNNLDSYKSQIESFLNRIISPNPVITMGNLKNVPMIHFVRSLGYDVNKKNQMPESLYNSNRKLIREHDLVIFLIHNHSSNMSDFLEYAKEMKINQIEVLNL